MRTGADECTPIASMYNRTMWTVYRRFNRQTQKSYVGITCATIDKRWKIDQSNAKKLARLRDAIMGKVYPHEGKIRTLWRAMGTVSMDLLLFGEDVWEHSILETHDSLLTGLLAEKRFIEKLGTNNPLSGYNRSSGGELPKWYTIDMLLKDISTLTVDDRVALGL